MPLGSNGCKVSLDCCLSSVTSFPGLKENYIEGFERICEDREELSDNDVGTELKECGEIRKLQRY